MAIQKWVFVILTVISSGYGQTVQAQTSPFAMGCIQVSELRQDNMAPQLARSFRDCIDQSRFDDAMQVFFAYSMYADFDRKRVREDLQNGAVVGLHNWVLSGFPRSAINELRFYAQALRDQKANYFQDTCVAILAAGPPTYSPYYLVGRGMEFETAKSDWQVTNFDKLAAWEQILATNGCPAG